MNIYIYIKKMKVTMKQLIGGVLKTLSAMAELT